MLKSTLIALLNKIEGDCHISPEFKLILHPADGFAERWIEIVYPPVYEPFVSTDPDDT